MMDNNGTYRNIYGEDVKNDFNGVPVKVGQNVIVSGGKTRYQGFRVMKVVKFTPKGFSVVPAEPIRKSNGKVYERDNRPMFYPVSAVAKYG